MNDHRRLPLQISLELNDAGLNPIEFRLYLCLVAALTVRKYPLPAAMCKTCGIDEAQFDTAIKVLQGCGFAVLVDDRYQIKDADDWVIENLDKQRKLAAEKSAAPQFTDAWVVAFEEAHGFKYIHGGGRDGRAVNLLLATKLPVAELIQIARDAWLRAASGGGMNNFGCKQAATIHGFQENFMKIRTELKLPQHSHGTRTPFVPRSNGTPALEARVL